MSAQSISLFRKMRRRFYWILVVLLLRLADLVPIGLGRRFCVLLARLGFRLRRRDAMLARANLAVAFPDGDAAGRERILEASVQALGRNLFDTLAVRRLLGDSEAVVDEDGAGALLEELVGQGRGVLILTGHLGCWELLGGWLARELGQRNLGPLAVVTGTVHNPAVDRLLQDRRRRLGLKVMPRQEGVRPLLRHLLAGGVGAILQDQNLRGGGERIPFFGRPAPTAPGLARIAVRYGIPVLPMAIGWNPSGCRHEIVRRSPLVVPTGEHGGDRARAMSVSANEALEAMIRRNPVEWVWFHDRWELAGVSLPKGG